MWFGEENATFKLLQKLRNLHAALASDPVYRSIISQSARDSEFIRLLGRDATLANPRNDPENRREKRRERLLWFQPGDRSWYSAMHADSRRFRGISKQWVHYIGAGRRKSLVPGEDTGNRFDYPEDGDWKIAASLSSRSPSVASLSLVSIEDAAVVFS